MEQSLKRIPMRYGYWQIFEPGLAVLSSTPQILSPSAVYFIFQRNVSFPLRFQGATEFSWKGRIQPNRPSRPLTAADLHPKSGSSGVSCSPEQPTSPSISELEAEEERNSKAELAQLVGSVCDWKGCWKGPTNVHIPFPPSNHWSTWPEIQKSGTVSTRPLINSIVLWNKWC